jgi:ribonuclease P protein component
MIGRKHRFHGYGSVRGVYKDGRTIRDSLLSLKTRQRGAHKPYRVAVVVSKKVNKSAVMRNRIRRRVYEAVRQAGDGIEPGTDLVFTVFSDQLLVSEPAKLQKAVIELLAKAGQAK